MKCIIAGGRDFIEYGYMCRFLDKIFSKNKPTEIVSGGASGADACGEKYAKEHGIQLKIFPANWDKHGKSAGPLRNKEMADYATHLVVFWDGKSRGTKSMIEIAKIKNIHTRIIRY